MKRIKYSIKFYHQGVICQLEGTENLNIISECTLGSKVLVVNKVD